MNLNVVCFGGRFDGKEISRSKIDHVHKSIDLRIERKPGFQTQVNISNNPETEKYILRVVRFRSEFKDVLIKKNDSIEDHVEAIKQKWEDLELIGFDLDEVI
ncbi:hypothetical protein [Acinetobacter baumannii]|uniref:hypothetical protein n=1 Tax=Acinetobacter baumannii TaxID=470 RepID=UPI00112D8827|nr:hypothetical protein [Acinetobacter baumannii]TPR82180.1 hypothetical protein FJV17_18285 [Acinetobacter baumannii]HAV4523680.1 hypothetical protein [Acinetobacter baumannii]HAV4565072.1 hypothetical protein [Acinetobacter baumannii]